MPASNNNDEPTGEPNEVEPLAHDAYYQQVLANLTNPELLSTIDLALLELEKRLLRYAKVGPEVLEMADEVLVLAVRARVLHARRDGGGARPGRSSLGRDHRGRQLGGEMTSRKPRNYNAMDVVVNVPNVGSHWVPVEVDVKSGRTWASGQPTR